MPLLKAMPYRVIYPMAYGKPQRGQITQRQVLLHFPQLICITLRDAKTTLRELPPIGSLKTALV